MKIYPYTDFNKGRIKLLSYFGFALYFLLLHSACLQEDFNEQVFARAITEGNTSLNVNEIQLSGRIDGIEGQLNPADYPVREFGFLISTTTIEPELESANREKIIVNDDFIQNETFSATLNNLSVQEIYFYRVYLILGERISYGNVASFSLADNVALTTLDTVRIENDNAFLQGVLFLKFQGTLEDHGFVYSKENELPEIDKDSIISFGPTNDDGIYLGTAQNLDLNSTYYVRSFAQLGPDVFYSAGTSVTFNTKDGWKNFAFLDRPRLDPLGLVIGTKGYVGLGCDLFCLTNDANTRFNTFFEFDPSLGEEDTGFMETTSGPPGRRGAVFLVIDSKIYCGLGRIENTWVKDFWEFDPSGNGSWQQMDDFPGAERTGAIGFSLESDKGYVGTGRGMDGFSHFGDFWVFYPNNTSGNQWELLSEELPTFQNGATTSAGRTEATVFILNNTAYVGTGKIIADTPLNDLWEFDANMESWTLATLPPSDFTPRTQAISFVINDRAYLGLGKNVNDKLRDLWEFDSQSNWTLKTDYPRDSTDLPRFAFTIGDKVYAGGQNSFQNRIDVLQYTPEN